MNNQSKYQRKPENGIMLYAPAKIQEIKEIIQENKLRLKSSGDLLLLIGAKQNVFNKRTSEN